MKKPMFSIYDNKAGTWLDPFYATNEAVAQRTFSDAVNDPQSMFNKHPTDFVLFHVGTWDDQKGKIEIKEPAKNMGLANDYLAADQQIRAVS